MYVEHPTARSFFFTPSVYAFNFRFVFRKFIKSFQVFFSFSLFSERFVAMSVTRSYKQMRQMFSFYSPRKKPFTPLLYCRLIKGVAFNQYPFKWHHWFQMWQFLYYIWFWTVQCIYQIQLNFITFERSYTQSVYTIEQTTEWCLFLFDFIPNKIESEHSSDANIPDCISESYFWHCCH